MLGDDLNKIKALDLSKSSFLPEDMDTRKLRDLLDQKDRTIWRLNARIEKLEAQLTRTQTDRATKIRSSEDLGNQNMQLQLLKAEINKTKRLEEIIDQITLRINVILQELSSDNSLTQNSQELREMLLLLQTSKFQNVQSQSSENEFQVSLNISEEWAKKIDILQGAFKTYKLRFKSISELNQSLTSQNEALQAKVTEIRAKITDNEDLRQLTLELKEEKKQKQKMKKLLQKTELSKNQLVNKINTIGNREEYRGKNKQELLQYSKELNYRIKDLENEKASILQESTKEKQEDLKKYQDFLKKLKVIKEKSMLGKSCA